MCFSATVVYYIGADSLGLNKFRNARKFRASPSFRLRSENREMSFPLLCPLFLFHKISRVRDIYKTSIRVSRVSTSSLYSHHRKFLQPWGNLGVNRWDWKCNFEIIARYIKVRPMQLYSTLYPNSTEKRIEYCRPRQDICTTDLLLQSPTLREQTWFINSLRSDSRSNVY